MRVENSQERMAKMNVFLEKKFIFWKGNNISRVPGVVERKIKIKNNHSTQSRCTLVPVVYTQR